MARRAIGQMRNKNNEERKYEIHWTNYLLFKENEEMGKEKLAIKKLEGESET